MLHWTKDLRNQWEVSGPQRFRCFTSKRMYNKTRKINIDKNKQQARSIRRNGQQANASSAKWNISCSALEKRIFIYLKLNTTTESPKTHKPIIILKLNTEEQAKYKNNIKVSGDSVNSYKLWSLGIVHLDTTQESLCWVRTHRVIVG